MCIRDSFTDDAGTDTELGSGSPAGSDGQLQYNNSSAFGGDSKLSWDDTNSILSVDGQLDQAIETWSEAEAESFEIDFRKSNLQYFKLDDLASSLAVTATGYTAGRTIRLLIDMQDDASGITTITHPSSWTNFGDDPSSLSGMGMVLVEITDWLGAESGTTAYWKESSS